MSDNRDACYLGLMSGTSMDGIDAALVQFDGEQPKLVATHSQEIPADLKQQIDALTTPGENEIDRLGQLDITLGERFAQAALELIDKAGIPAEHVTAIGSHGQTIRHRPELEQPFTLQIADPNIIAHRTGITTVADFRRHDMAAGGQGAPLVPAFHSRVFRDVAINRAILNIGGIANLTLLPCQDNAPITGFDTGPGNGLLDSWTQRHTGNAYDKDGTWSRSGKVQPDLLKRLLADPYFNLTAPKSTGREYFNPQWLDAVLNSEHFQYTAEDVAATLVELTAISICDALARAMPECEELYICGGGVHNSTMTGRISDLIPAINVQSTAALGIDPDWVEAMAFAWLAKQALQRQPGNLPTVTGADRHCILGGIYYA